MTYNSSRYNSPPRQVLDSLGGRIREANAKGFSIHQRPSKKMCDYGDLMSAQIDKLNALKEQFNELLLQKQIFSKMLKEDVMEQIEGNLQRAKELYSAELLNECLQLLEGLPRRSKLRSYRGRIRYYQLQDVVSWKEVYSLYKKMLKRIASKKAWLSLASKYQSELDRITKLLKPYYLGLEQAKLDLKRQKHLKYQDFLASDPIPMLFTKRNLWVVLLTYANNSQNISLFNYKWNHLNGTIMRNIRNRPKHIHLLQTINQLHPKTN
eukprot:TRINITY_DN3415_c0_g1_i1.p1 TRINITY_DN3415_c0_g1~~TRINITY_DN3415_c0_g1_i1.p1  ORF type:complete len:266 (+),score=53.01 TRINITY_DN3415_c0_g1_i1:345-1142(+)